MTISDGDPRFHMCSYTNGDEYAATCGSVGCAVGHGPYAGIAKDHNEDFNGYCNRVFNVSEDEWFWCFSGLWYMIDNTAQGAAKRILWLLEKGLPQDRYEQMNGENPLCYR